MEADPEFPWEVEIPIPPAGLGPMLPVILDAVQACKGGAVVTTVGVPEGAEVRSWFNRIATRSPSDARQIAYLFRSIGARQIR